jgi:hypothetical protein
MANAALELLKREHAASRAAATRREKMRGYESMFIRKGAGILTAATFGTLNRLDVSVSVGWFPWKLAVSAIALAVEGTTSGKVQAAAAGVGEATNAIYVERSISENTLIVGEGPTGYIAQGDPSMDYAPVGVPIEDGGEV